MSERPPEAAPSVHFDAVLYPHRSLPPRGFAILMALLGSVGGCVGIALVLLGAWPVTPFLGLDVLLLFIAFRLSYRSARQHEAIRLTDDSLVVERVSPRGERRHWRFQPFWLRVVLEEPSEDTNRVLLTSHGRSLVVAGFLGPAERRRFATALTAALARWRTLVASPP